MADVNGDGKPDPVVTSSGINNLVSVLLGNGNATFQSQTTFSDNFGSNALVVADLTGDGKPDLIVADLGGYLSNGGLSVLLNKATGDFTGQVYTVHAAPYLVVSLPLSVTAGSAFTFTVTAYDASSNILPAYTGTVHFATSDAGTGSALPADYTFTASDGGVHVFTAAATLVTAGTQIVTVTDTSSAVITGSASLSVTPATATALILTAPAIATEGTAFAITVTARDSLGNIAQRLHGHGQLLDVGSRFSTAACATWHLQHFVAADHGVHVFSFGVTLVTIGAGSQTITVTDGTGLTNTVTVDLPTPWPFVQSINRSTPQGTVTSPASVAYTVTFSKPVTGVTAADFRLALTGTVAATISPGDTGFRRGLHGHRERHFRRGHGWP